jgi:flagellar motor switch protein FliM
MSDEQTDNALKRKVRAGQPAPDIAPMSMRKAFRLAVSKAGDKCNGLAMTLVGLKVQSVGLDSMLEELTNEGLYLLLAGPARNQGFVSFDTALVAGLIEMQTLGRVLPGAVAARVSTPTDATMNAPFVDDLLAEFEEALVGTPDWLWANGFRSASKLAGPRPLGLILEDVRFRLYRLSLDMANGTRTGELMLCFPAQARGTRSADGQDQVLAAPSWKELIRSSISEAKVAMHVVLDRQTLSLARIEAFTEGDVIEVSRSALSAARLETVYGQSLRTGRIGQINGNRAILLEGPSADVNARALDVPLASGRIAASDLTNSVVPKAMQADGAGPTEPPAPQAAPPVTATPDATPEDPTPGDTVFESAAEAELPEPT